MEKLTELIEKKFNNKFSYLQFLEIVYNLKNNTCTISFLYPENNKELTTETKNELTQYLQQSLNLNANLIVKFIKSFLDKDNITQEVLNFFSTQKQSIGSVIKKENIKVTFNTFDTNIALSLPSQILDNLSIENLSTKLIKYLKTKIIAEFSCDITANNNFNETDIITKIEKDLKQKLKNIDYVRRYKVFNVEKLIGKDITPEPEYIANIHNDKGNVIIAGKVSNIVKKTYKRTYKKGEVEKTYYKFTLHEENKYLNMLYFCPKANITKMDKIQDGDDVLVIVDIKKENNFLTGFVSSLSLCEINNDVRKSFKEKITTYKVVKPEPYAIISQGNIFDKAIMYDDYILNNDFVVFDVETTGLDPSTCEIIEIGAVKITKGKITEKFQTLVKPTAPISSLITDLTGITNEMVENAPPINTVIKDFYLFTKDTILSGYNVNFDLQFIQRAGNNWGVKFLNENYDVLVLARAKVHSKNYKLGTIVKVLDLRLDNAHRAFFDALATAEILLKLMQK